jgi:chlorobactene glucosyltransferase
MILTALGVAAICLWAAAIWAMRRNYSRSPCIDDEPVWQPAGVKPSSVLVVVPARDEERNISACLDALCQSRFPCLRIRVVDDGSTDRTPEIVKATARRDSRIEVITLRDLPDGWLGKSHALWRAASGAKEDWFLFVDADVRLAPSCIARAIAAAQRLQADLLTVIPAIETVTFWEVAVQAIIVHLVLLLLDVAAVNRPESTRAAAIGPILLFRRSAYERIGGHEAVRAEVAEDLRLAEAVKRAGLRLVLARGTQVAVLRMYDSLGSIVRGWSKNFHIPFNDRYWLAAPAVLLLVFFYGAPWLLPVVGIACGDRLGAAAGGLAALVALGARIDFAVLYGVTARRPYLAPLGAAVLGWILVRSVFKAVRRQPAHWKGRAVPVTPNPIHDP